VSGTVLSFYPDPIEHTEMSKRKKLPYFPHQFTYFVALRIRRILQKVSGRLVTPQMAVYEKAQGFWISRAIYTACEMGLADSLIDGPKKVSELAKIKNSDEEYLYRLLRALAGEGVFRELSGRVFSNNRLSLWLTEAEGSLKYLVLHQFNPMSTEMLVRLSESVRSGEDLAVKVLGTTGYKHHAANPRKNEIYQRSMDESSEIIALALISAYNFNGIGTLVDAGGGKGTLLANILRAFPNIRGILFDQPHVVALAEEVMKKYQTDDRMQVFGGDLFDGVPQGADAYLMKNVLHTYGDEKCIKLLKNIRESMALGGKLLILEAVVEPPNEPTFGKLVDLLMMTGTEGGKERTREEYRRLLDDSGFRISRVVRTVAPFSVIIAEKA
jgi:hypothetical protein